ncbi:MAG: hypothetical protein NUK54_10815 [Methanothrix sp.]|nr:hypothetical protein [Methanothrix sp.]
MLKMHDLAARSRAIEVLLPPEGRGHTRPSYPHFGAESTPLLP